jgi:hypothetical protein
MLSWGGSLWELVVPSRFFVVSSYMRWKAPFLGTFETRLTSLARATLVATPGQELPLHELLSFAPVWAMRRDPHLEVFHRSDRVSGRRKATYVRLSELGRTRYASSLRKLWNC